MQTQSLYHVTPCEAKAGFHMESLVGLLLLEKLRLGQTSSLKMAQCFTSYYGVLSLTMNHFNTIQNKAIIYLLYSQSLSCSSVLDVRILQQQQVSGS